MQADAGTNEIDDRVRVPIDGCVGDILIPGIVIWKREKSVQIRALASGNDTAGAGLLSTASTPTGSGLRLSR